jgi:hypothetical protein
MDHKTKYSESLASNLLSAVYVDTPYGRVCTSMEVPCIKCKNVFEITVPDKTIKKINNKASVGTSIIEYILSEAGWVYTTAKRKNNKESHYSVCPDCVEHEFNLG